MPTTLEDLGDLLSGKSSVKVDITPETLIALTILMFLAVTVGVYAGSKLGKIKFGKS